MALTSSYAYSCQASTLRFSFNFKKIISENMDMEAVIYKSIKRKYTMISKIHIHLANMQNFSIMPINYLTQFSGESRKIYEFHKFDLPVTVRNAILSPNNNMQQYLGSRKQI